MFFRGRSKEAEGPGKADGEAVESTEAALLDEATGLYKSWYFERRLNEEVQRCARYGRVFTLLYWEPRLLPGEVLEPQVMARAAAVVKEGLRQTDLAAQTERTRFAAILVEADQNTGRTVAFRMKTQLASRVRGAPGTWRAGMAVFPDDGVDAVSLLRVAARRLVEDVSMAA